jgi:hypothetical protein
MFKYFLRNNYFLNPEIVHFYDSVNKDIILSHCNKFYLNIDNKENFFIIKLNWYLNFFSKFRILRRLFRLDKSNVVLNYKRDGVIILYQKIIYFYNFQNKICKKVSRLKNHRNVLHNSIAVTKNGIFFGEYGPNNIREKVPVWCSYNDGRSWKIIYNFPRNSIKHVHGIYNDPFENSLWITAGDNDNECFIYKVPNKNFKKIIKYGDGSQEWRAVSLLFKKKYVIWGMDSPLQTSFLKIFNKKTKELRTGRSFPGPVWYSKTFADHSAVLQTSVEIGCGVKSTYSCLFYSKDLVHWYQIYKFKKDIYPKKLFKFGVIAFSEGKQNSKDFLFSAEGLKKIDGKVFLGKINLK